ncbi:hypothetical protein [Flammeovirga aprica]|uniref:Uncharacterized protein n=1 Tax=Flammeovirga aprica JL-4 TaxID=694437 RepID=A0A7X9S172_9BACT|nr:hypothetical protein [Flammeovirga aprica]NME72277.1 hypothetical protein [Flammeovirga aprica JL-4]
MENFEDRLFDLFSQKSFEELTSEEQELVLKNMTEEEYQENYAMIHEFKEVDASITIATTSLATEKGKTINYFYQSIPVYKAVAGIVLAVLLSFILQFYVFQNEKKITVKDDVSPQSTPLTEENYPSSLVVNL